MARARNIKPGFYKNEELAECSVWARFIFPGLWMLADREGRLEDRPKRIKAELLPFDGEDVDALLNELQAKGFLVRYRNSEGAFIQISAFKKHQTPHYSEKASVIKPPSLQEDSEKSTGLGDSDTPRGLQEDSRNYPPMKRGSQPPDSLNPDCLNPDSPKKTRVAPLALPSWVPEDAWKAWLEVRPKVKAPNTPHALGLALKELGKLRDQGHDPRAVLESATLKGWRGLFAPTKSAAEKAQGFHL